MREEYAQAIYVHGCVMPWCVPRGALLIECSKQHAVSMSSLGVNVVPIRAPILMLAQTRKNKSSHRFCPVSHAAILLDSTRAATCALAWALAGVNSFHWEELGLRSCSSVWQHACFQPLVRWHGDSLMQD